LQLAVMTINALTDHICPGIKVLASWLKKGGYGGTTFP